MPSWLLVCVGMLPLSLAAGQVPAKPTHAGWRLCVPDIVAPPYLTGNPAKPGVTERLLLAIGAQLGQSVEILPYPARRCRMLMEAGEVDATLAAPTPQNLDDYQFPLLAGAIDPSRKLARLQLVWIKRADSPLAWDGQEMSGETHSGLLVGTRASFRIATDALARLGFKHDEHSFTTSNLLMKLQAKRIDLALCLTEELGPVQSEIAALKLVVLPRPFLVSDFYLVFGRTLPPQRQALLQAWWDAVGKLRDTPDFRAR